MCGICGVFTADGGAAQVSIAEAVRRMTDLMRRRGPDDAGQWSDPNGRVQIGVRRLAVIDPTPAGHQPMLSSSGRSVLAFNGEIYNFQELRGELEARGVSFRSRSDSEVLVEALEYWGPSVVSRLNGMFAFAWYDTQAQALLLARDHAGIKPLYYSCRPDGHALVFASQFNCLLHAPWGSPGRVRLDVLRLYLRLHHIPPPYGLLENTYQLEPGSWLRVDAEGRCERRRWWSLPRAIGSDVESRTAEAALAGALDRAVRRQRIADVPLGVFLSGGVDSPLIAAVARGQTGPGLKAFTIGTTGWSQDESDAARRYGTYLDLDHRIHAVTADEVRSTIEDVTFAQHEPLGDFSIVPTLLVSRLARRDATVALSGDGGDELFFGYERPLSLLRDGEDFRWPWAVRSALYLAGTYGAARRRSDVLLARTPGHYYFEVNSRLKDADLRLLAPGLPALPPDFDLYASQPYGGLRQLADYSRWVEFYGQLQRGLKKVDMASMHHSLEVRVPLLDREVIEASLTLDPLDSLRNGVRKPALRNLLAGFVPADAMPTPKRGFAIPLGDFLRNSLRSVVEETLLEGDLYPDGIFDRREVRRYWEGHLNGGRDAKWGLWTLLALQWWARAHVRVPAPCAA